MVKRSQDRGGSAPHYACHLIRLLKAPQGVKSSCVLSEKVKVEMYKDAALFPPQPSSASILIISSFSISFQFFFSLLFHFPAWFADYLAIDS